MFIVKNETFTGLILMAPFLYRGVPSKCVILGFFLRRPDLFVNNGSCLRFFGSWRLGCCLNRTSSQKPLYISKRCYFHRSACSLPSNGKLAHRAFLVLCGRCVNWPAFSLSSVCASCRASSCFDISGAGCASIPLPNSLSFSVILSVVRCCNKCSS